EGALGKEFSLLKVDAPNVRVLALKKAENSDDVIVRAVETDGQNAKAEFTFAAPVAAAREVNGQEMPVGAAQVANGELAASFGPYQIHTFAVKLAPAATHVVSAKYAAVTLNYDANVATMTGKPAEGCFDCSFNDPTADGQGHALPAEMLPGQIEFDGIRFQIAPYGKNDAVIARGQQVALPAGDFHRVYVLAAAYGGDQQGTFALGEKSMNVDVPEWTGFVGQWDSREWNIRQEQVPAKGDQAAYTRTVMDFTGKIDPGLMKRAQIAWYASHRHDRD